MTDDMDDGPRVPATSYPLCFHGLHEMTPDNCYYKPGRNQPTCRVCKRDTTGVKKPRRMRTPRAQEEVRQAKVELPRLFTEAGEQPWLRDAACRDEDPDLFFPPGETGVLNAEQIDEAKAICAHCPVRVECREWAIRTGQPYAVAGGLTEAERRTLRATRGLRAASPGDVDMVVVERLIAGRQVSATLDEKAFAGQLMINAGVSRFAAADALSMSWRTLAELLNPPGVEAAA